MKKKKSFTGITSVNCEFNKNVFKTTKKNPKSTKNKYFIFQKSTVDVFKCHNIRFEL